MVVLILNNHQAITHFEKMDPSMTTKPITKIVQGIYTLNYNIYGDIIWDNNTIITGIAMTSYKSTKSIRVKYKYK